MAHQMTKHGIVPKSLIVIHTPPRTGSSAMVQFIRSNVGDQCTVIRVHYLLAQRNGGYGSRNKKTIRRYDKKDWAVIHLARDVIARNLSAFWSFFYFRNRITSGEPELSTFEGRFLEELDHLSGASFIKDEIEPFWRIEIMANRFQPPYTVYGDQVAILRYEDFDCKNDLLRDFLGAEPNIEPPIIHCSGDAGDANDYKVILDTIRLPVEYVNLMYDTPYMRTFYSEEEISVLKERWTEGTKADHPIIQKPEAIRNVHNPETCPACQKGTKRREESGL